MDGVEIIDGVEVPYINAKVQCDREGCPAYGIVYEIKLLYGAEGSMCYPCNIHAKESGLPEPRHKLKTEDVARLKHLKEPKVWKQIRLLAEKRNKEEEKYLRGLGAL